MVFEIFIPERKVERAGIRKIEVDMDADDKKIERFMKISSVIVSGALIVFTIALLVIRFY